MIVTVKQEIPAPSSFVATCSLKCAVTGRSNPLGLKSILKVITSFARRAPFEAKRYEPCSTRGNAPLAKIEDSSYRRKTFIRKVRVTCP